MRRRWQTDSATANLPGRNSIRDNARERRKKSKGGRKVQRYDTPKAIRAQGPDKTTHTEKAREYCVRACLCGISLLSCANIRPFSRHYECSTADSSPPSSPSSSLPRDQFIFAPAPSLCLNRSLSPPTHTGRNSIGLTSSHKEPAFGGT
jgi:hypothetical protein